MNKAIQYVSQRKTKTIALIGLSFAAGYAVRWYLQRNQAFVIPGSKSTIPDQEGHYDMDGVSFDDHKGVVVGSDATENAKPPRGLVQKMATALKRDELPASTS